MDTLEDLEKRIAARKKEAEDKQIRMKVSCIVRALGHQESADFERGGLDRWIYTDRELLIDESCSNFSSGMNVSYKDKPVFEEGAGEIHSYIPGPWEALLDTLYERIPEEQAKKAETDQAEQARWLEVNRLERAKRFGL